MIMNQRNKDKVSVIIVNYNTLELTKNCIDSIFDKTRNIKFEVILVDNGSTDGSKEYFERDERITYIYSKENLVFGLSNNLGYTHATGEYMFLLNSDTYLLNNAIYFLLEGFKEADKGNFNVACAGAMLQNPEGVIVHSYARFPKMVRSVLEWSIYVVLWKLHLLKHLPSTSNYEYDRKREEDSFDVDYITGADLMIRMDVADKFGLFDPDFFMYCEETEMEHRYMKQGLRRIILSKPEIVHLEGASNTQYSMMKSLMLMRSYFLYYKKTRCKPLYYLFCMVFKTSYVITRLVCFPFVRGNVREKFSYIVKVVCL